MIRTVICDLDGTLSDCRARNHLAAQGAWDEFHFHMQEDPPVHHVMEFLHIHLKQQGNGGLYFLTGRPEEFRSVTVDWLYRQCSMSEGTEYAGLIMRPENDWRPDVKIKPELFIEHVVEPLNQTIGSTGDANKSDFLFLDDRDKVVAMWRDLGYDCWQTAEGAF